jgi:hypothetical protein
MTIGGTAPKVHLPRRGKKEKKVKEERKSVVTTQKPSTNKKTIASKIAVAPMGLLTKKGIVATQQLTAAKVVPKTSNSSKKEPSESVPLIKTKVIMRHLPPTLEEKNFLDTIGSTILDQCHYVRYVPGNISKNGHIYYSRAYLSFKTTEQMLEAYRKFDGHVFVDTKGVTFKTLIEYAPYQGIPSGYDCENPKENTIENDELYLDFLQSLSEKTTEKQDIIVNEIPEITPLIQYLMTKKAKKASSHKKTK